MKDRIRLVMADLDGTLLTSEQKVDARTIRAIDTLRKQGILFGLCTGREGKSVMNSLAAWGIEGRVDVLVSGGGGVIEDLQLKTKEQFGALPARTILEIMKHHEDQKVNFVIPDEGILYTTVDDELIQMVSRVDHVPYQTVSLEDFLKTSRMKMMLVCDEKDMPGVQKRGAEFQSDEIRLKPLVTASVLFEYMDPSISKSAALQRVLDLHGWSADNLLVFGDQDNDADMLKFAGTGVCMANGSELSRKAADFITADNDHEGVALFLEEHVLQEEQES